MTPTTSSQDLLAQLTAQIRTQILAETQSTTRPPAAAKRLLTPREAGEYLGRTESAVRQLIHKRMLPVIRFGRNVRIDVRDLDRIIDANRM
jgi:excisionase family DNA binding protein